MPKLIDTHCHVNFNAYKDDSDEVVKRTLKEDVWMISVGSQASTSARAVKISKKYKVGVFAAVGLHPLHLWESYVDEVEIPFKTKPEKFNKNFYEKLAKNQKVVAIGETGLDYYHLPKDKKEVAKLKIKQKKIFQEHLDLARELNLPVIIHCRDAHDDILKIFESLSPRKQGTTRAVVHCFTEDWKTAKKYLDLGFLISFTGIITFSKDEKMREVVEKTPIEKIMIETDAPYLTPEPHRGKRNEPLYVRHVAEKVAEIRGVSFEEIAKQTTKNAIEFFGLK
ncbi:MAG: TatD family hydrolase [Patescibacteria group bacterium]|nr:TatD family hydrolase [Patescibacteria group bacterium]